MEDRKFQNLLLEKIKAQLNENHTLIDHVTEVLSLSKDSGYRRIRGETALSFDEAILLARHFRIALSEVTGHADNSAIFQKQAFITNLEEYRQYMQDSLEQLQYIKSQRNHQLIYSAKDIPIFYQFAFPKLAAFKIFVWLKSVYDIQSINDQHISLKEIPEDLLLLAHQQWTAYSQINAIEIWNDTTIMSLINQITYYYEAGLLKNREEALGLCDEFQEMIKVIYKQALSGQKVHANNPEVNSGAFCKMYFHEILLMDNHILAEAGENRLIYFIPYGGLNFMSTMDPALTQNMKDFLEGQTKKSALISDVSEKDRNRFFIRIKTKIDQLREKINSTDPFI